MAENSYYKLLRATSIILIITLISASFFNNGAYVVAANSVKNDVQSKRLSLGEILNAEAETGQQYGVLSVNIATTAAAMAQNVLMARCPSGFPDLLMSLVLLSEYDAGTEITITAAAIEAAEDNNSDINLNEGDTFTLSGMLDLLLIGGSDVSRRSLAEFYAGGEEAIVEQMNLYAKRLGTTNTRISNIRDTYDDRQYTNVYDIYIIISALLEYDAFARSFGSESADVAYTDAEGAAREMFISRTVNAVEKDVELPEGFEFVGKLTGKDEEFGNNQIVLVKNSKGEYCMTILMGLDESVDINLASGNLIRTFLGEAFNPYQETEKDVDEVHGILAEAVVPTESNDARYQYLFGTDAQFYTTSNKPAGYETERSASRYMRSITVPVWKMRTDGRKYSSTYTIKIHKDLVESVKAIFREIYELDIRFPIKYMVGFRYRKVGGVGLMSSRYMSVHSFGAAIDINPSDYDNDYYLGAGNDMRDRTNPYCIPDEVIAVFEKYGWFWGGNFSICADTMHFQYLGLEFLQYDSDEPFPILSREAENEKAVVKNLTERLVELEYLEKTRTSFNKSVEKAVKQFQTDHDIEPTGVVNYETWEILINLTHYMSYVF